MRFYAMGKADASSGARATNAVATSVAAKASATNASATNAGAATAFEAGIQLGLKSILVSPSFLFRREAERAGAIQPISDLDMASRLSFFLWSSIPDDELLTLAEQKRLNHPEVLRAQVRRMLADQRSEALVTNFGGQWLQLRNVAALKPDPQILQSLKIAVVGQKTAQFLQARGFTATYTPSDFVADALLANFPENPAGQRILFPRVESGGREVLVEGFAAKGATITAVAAYQSGCPTTIDPTALAALESGKIDIISFASSKTVQHFCRLLEQALGDRWQSLLDPVIIASIGPQTTLTCETQLGRIDLEAQEYTLPGLTRAIVEFVTQSR